MNTPAPTPEPSNPPVSQAAAPQKLAFLGLGVMGAPMAAHLARAGHTVTVYNRTTSKSIAWCAQQASAGAVKHAQTPRLAAQGAALVLCCVGNDDDLRSVALGADGAFAGMEPGSVFVDHTTASAEVARELHSAARTLGLHFVDAPVSGGQAGAQNGQLTVLCGGDPAAFAMAAPVMQAYARACTLLGGSGAGQLAKMVNQICVVGLLQGLAEGLAFGEAAGLDMAQVLGAIGQGAAQSWQMQQRGPTMLAAEFELGFAVDLMRKDLGLVLDEARRNGAQLPVTALVDQFYADLQRMGGQRWDTSSLIQRLR